MGARRIVYGATLLILANNWRALVSPGARRPALLRVTSIGKRLSKPEAFCLSRQPPVSLDPMPEPFQPLETLLLFHPVS